MSAVVDAGEYAAVLVVMYEVRLIVWDDRRNAVRLLKGTDIGAGRVGSSRSRRCM